MACVRVKTDLAGPGITWGAKLWLCLQEFEFWVHGRRPWVYHGQGSGTEEKEIASLASAIISLFPDCGYNVTSCLIPTPPPLLSGQGWWHAQTVSPHKPSLASSCLCHTLRKGQPTKDVGTEFGRNSLRVCVPSWYEKVGRDTAHRHKHCAHPLPFPFKVLSTLFAKAVTDIWVKKPLNVHHYHGLARIHYWWNLSALSYTGMSKCEKAWIEFKIALCQRAFVCFRNQQQMQQEILSAAQLCACTYLFVLGESMFPRV